MQQHQPVYISTDLTPINEGVINHISLNQQQQQQTKSITQTSTPEYPQMRSHSIQVQPVDQFNTAVPPTVNLECKFQNLLNE
jgi:hypothetical protein